MNSKTTFIVAFILIAATLSYATRPEPIPESTTQIPQQKDNNEAGGEDNGYGGFFGPGSGFNIPGMGSGIIGGGYGGGYGGPNGGYGKGGIIRPTIVCQEKGPCFKKKLTCPSKCFHSYSRSGKGYGGGGGGGGCTMDCKKKCIAYC